MLWLDSPISNRISQHGKQGNSREGVRCNRRVTEEATGPQTSVVVAAAVGAVRKDEDLPGQAGLDHTVSRAGCQIVGASGRGSRILDRGAVQFEELVGSWPWSASRRLGACSGARSTVSLMYRPAVAVGTANPAPTWASFCSCVDAPVPAGLAGSSRACASGSSAHAFEHRWATRRAPPPRGGLRAWQDAGPTGRLCGRVGE